MSKPLLACGSLLASTPMLALTVNLQVQNETCAYSNGSVYASVSGGVPPYTYLWGGGETTESLSNLSAGTYSVTVTDFLGEQVSDLATVISENYPDYFAWTHMYCPGQEYHIPFEPQPPVGLSGDFSPYTVSQGIIEPITVPITNGYYYIDIGPLAPGAGFNLTAWDANGCPTQISGVAGEPATVWPTVGMLAVEGSCANMNTGSITFTTTGSAPNESYPILRRPGDGTFELINQVQWDNACQCSRFSNLAPGDYWLMVSLAITPMIVQGGTACSSDSVLVTVPDLGGTCGVISGSTYLDYNSDCIDAEADAVGVVVELEPGPYYTTSWGGYSVAVPNGSYTLTTSAPAIAQSCPASATVNGNYVSANIGHQPTIPLDVAVSLSSGPARPGFELHYLVHTENMSSSSSGATTTTFTYDPMLGYIQASPAPTSTSPGVLTWDQAALNIFQHRNILVRLQVPADVGLIGTVLLANASVATANTDGNLANNTAAWAITVTGSFDPNDKTAYTSTRWSNELYFINEDEWIDYVIRFQNTGTDTAFNIVVTDTLPEVLDPATISLVGASHEFGWSVLGQGVLRFMFPNIVLPDSNVNEPASHGLISFRIRPRLPLLPGTTIENIANIYFDFNPPVITEPSVLSAELSTGVGAIDSHALIAYPNPTSDILFVIGEGLGAGELLIRTLDGRSVMSKPVRSTRVALDVASLATGTYVIEARGADAVEVLLFNITR